jgi:hypothetical protein
MNQFRPILTALCFALFAAAFAWSHLDALRSYQPFASIGEPITALFATLAYRHPGDRSIGSSRRTRH